MIKWVLNKPVKMKNFNKFEKQNEIVSDIKVKQVKFLSLLLDGKKVK
jgi:hypothetical protein